MLNVHSYELPFCWLEDPENNKLEREREREQISKVYVSVYLSRLNKESSQQLVSELLMRMRLFVMVRSLVSSVVGIP